jgi:Spy/CpxP family protein refolding chaperone
MQRLLSDGPRGACIARRQTTFEEIRTMKIATRYLLAAALAAAPVTAVAQNTAPPPPQHGQHHGPQGGMHGRHGGPGGEHHSPIAGILQHRQQLGLTAEQVSRLETIDRDLRARVEPLHQQLMALMPEELRAAAHGPGAPAQGERRQRPEGAQRQGGHGHGGGHPRLTAEQRQRMEQIHQQARPLMEQVHQHVQAAMEQVHTVLTPEQQRQGRALMERHHGPGGEHGRPGGEHGRHGQRPREGGRPPR